jgi:hypothetical protein
MDEVLVHVRRVGELLHRGPGLPGSGQYTTIRPLVDRRHWALGGDQGNGEGPHEDGDWYVHCDGDRRVGGRMKKGCTVRSRGFSQVCMNGDTLRHARRSEIVVDHRARDLSEVRPNVRPRSLGRTCRLSEDVFGCDL